MTAVGTTVETVSHELAEPRPVDQFEIGRAPARERVAAAKIITNRNAPHALGEIGRAVARVDEIAQDCFERASFAPAA